MKRWGITAIYIMTAVFLAVGCGERTDSSPAGDDAVSEADDSDAFFMEEDLPDVRKQYAEKKEYPELAEFLIEYYGIAEIAQRGTRYYYNYVDLNEDGTDEILVIVLAEDDPGDDGGPALILRAKMDGTFVVLEDFEQVITPVMISDDMTNGWHDVIYSSAELLERGFLICRYDREAGYQSEKNEFVTEMPQVDGTKLLCNNLIDDMDQGNYMTLKN